MYTIINIPIVVTTCTVYCRYHLSSYKARPVYIKLPPSLILSYSSMQGDGNEVGSHASHA